MESDHLLSDKENPFYPNVPKSVYEEDFQIVSVKRADKIMQQPDFINIIAGPYIDPLQPDSKILDPSKCESADEFYNRTVCKYPSLKKVVLREAIDQTKLESEYTSSIQSTYQLDYPQKGERHEVQDSNLHKLMDYFPIEEPIAISTQRRSYQDWGKKIPWKMERTKPFQQPEATVGMSRTEQCLLNIETGKTEYGEIISDSGADIINYSFYGEVKALPLEYSKKN